MPRIAITPVGAIQRPDDGAQATVRRRDAIRLCATFSLVLSFQAVAAAPAAVATLPSALLARPVTAPLPVPEFRKNPGLFRSIIEATFPRAARTKPPSGLSVPTEAAADPNELIPFGGRTASRWLVHSVLRAAQVAGVDPVYMLTLADIESSLSNEAKAPTSSAEGLFQFIDRTWIETVYLHAADYGLERASRAIQIVDGDPVVSDDKERAWIMGLRTDPYFSALMAGELIKDVERALHAQGERELEEAELYLAHFLGAGSAVQFLEVLDSDPNMSATKLFPKAAKANAGLFTEGKGRKRRALSVAELYNRIDSKIVRRMDRYEDIGPILAEITTVAAIPKVDAYAEVR